MQLKGEATINKARIKDDNLPLLFPFENDYDSHLSSLKNKVIIIQTVAQQNIDRCILGLTAMIQIGGFLN